MTSKNEITGDKLQSKIGDQEKFSEGYDKIIWETSECPIYDEEDDDDYCPH